MLEIAQFSGLVILYVMKTPLGRSFCKVNLGDTSMYVLIFKNSDSNF